MKGTISGSHALLRARVVAFVFTACLGLATGHASAQQFNSDNQWVAPHGVATMCATVGQEYSTAASYGDSFSGGGSPRFEIGAIFLTNQLKFLCLGKCQKDPDW